jgi:hypothetical protein
MRGKARCLTRNFVVKVDGMAEGQRPEIPLIVLGPAEGSIYHEGAAGAAGANSVLDSIFGHSVVVMAANAAVLDSLSLGGQFGGKFLGRVDPIVGTICSNLDLSGCGFTLESELGLNGLGPGETNLVNHGEFSTRSITEDGASTKLLSS